MIEESFFKVFEKFRFQYFHRLFGLMRERKTPLSAMEVFSLGIIEMLQSPTIGQFADFLNISQSNATYKVSSLISKGYVIRQNSEKDRREYHLVLAAKYYESMELLNEYEHLVSERIKKRFSAEELAAMDRILTTIYDELMPECDEIFPPRKNERWKTE